MAYEFKRLSDVEELTEVPEGAKALAVVDGAVKRVPFGGGNAKLEDMMFDLDVGMPSNGQLVLTNNEQLQKVYDKNMSIYVVYSNVASGFRYVHRSVCPSVKEALPVSVVSGGMYVTATGNYFDAYAKDSFLCSINFDADKFAADETLEVTGTSMYVPTWATVERVYASIF